jgi:hypothetical protein
VLIIERHLAFRVGTDRKHRNFRTSLSSSPISPGHGSRLDYQEVLDFLPAGTPVSQSSISTNFSTPPLPLLGCLRDIMGLMFRPASFNGM